MSHLAGDNDQIQAGMMIFHTEGLIAGRFQYALCTSEKAFKKEMRRLKVDNQDPFLLPGSNATVHYFDKDDGQNIAILCITPWSNHLQVVALMAHEAYHIYRYNMELIREGRPGEEVAAYCIQIILHTLLNDLAKVKLKFYR